MSNLGYMDDNGERVDLGPRSVSETEQNRINLELERLAFTCAKCHRQGARWGMLVVDTVVRCRNLDACARRLQRHSDRLGAVTIPEE